MDEALQTLRPFRRVNSLPGSLADPAVTYEYPSCIDDALNAPRQSFSTYDKGMRTTPLHPDAVRTADVHAVGHDINISSPPMPDTQNVTPHSVDLNRASEVEETGVCSAAVLACPQVPTEGSMTDEVSSSDEGNEHAQQLNRKPTPGHEGSAADAEDAVADTHNSASHSAASSEKLSDDGADHEVQLHDEEAREQEDDAAETLPRLTATEECMAYDAAQMQGWLAAYRSCQDHCPAGIAQFLQALPFSRLKRANAAAAAALSFPAFGSKLGQVPPADANAGQSSSHPPPVHASGRQALKALGDIWEDRKDMPIAVATAHRRRGLFGEVEKKELYQMVISVLNKVTTDPVKFREVKNELLRLPIPEANPEQLDEVVDVFFSKAVHEPHFCHSYAALIAALCKVPRGQHITGDKTLSLEYRLRRSLVRRCQKEFVAGSQQDTEGDEETTKERRQVMVGNVRFVCELFLLSIVTENVVTIIFTTCCTGSEFGVFVSPPTYMPTEAQVDEMISAIQAVGLRYFQTQRGREILPALQDNLRHWTQHHKVSRCRFLLMTTVDTLEGFKRDLDHGVTASTPAASPVLSAASPGSQVFSPVSATSDHLAASGFASTSNVHAVIANDSLTIQSTTALAAVTSLTSPTNVAGGTPKSTTTVGGKALPVPRSQRGGSVTNASIDGASSPMLSPSAASPASGAGKASQPLLSPPSDGKTGALPVFSAPRTAFTSPSASLAASAAPQEAERKAPLPREALKQPVRPEAVAKLMADYASGATSPEATSERIVEQYGDPLPVLAAWFDRCFSVFREEKTRLRTGELLAAVLAGGLADVLELRDQVFCALRRAVGQNLHEDLKLFRFWAQCILSDRARAVLDEDMLEDGLAYVYSEKASAVRAYLGEVGAWYSTVLAEKTFVPAEETQGFVRYRPLSCLTEMLGLGHGGDPARIRETMLATVNFPDVRKSSLEIDIYCTLCLGCDNYDVIFKKVCGSPRLKSDPTLAASVISAVLLAEQVCPDGRAFLENSLPTLVVAVDGANRAEREAAVVVEAQTLIRRMGLAPTHAADARVFMKLRSFGVASDETIDRVQRYLVERAAAESAVEADGSADDQPVAQQESADGGDGPSDDAAPTQRWRQIEAAQPQAQAGAAAAPATATGERRPTDSLNGGSDPNSSSNSSHNAFHGGGSGSGSGGSGGGGRRRRNGSGSAGGEWRSSNGSTVHTPDAAQLQHSRSGKGRAHGSTSHGHGHGTPNSNTTTGRGRYNYRTGTASANDSTTDSPMVGHRVTGYQGPRARGGGASGGGAGGRKTGKYNYQSSSSYYGYGSGARASHEDGAAAEGKKK